MWLAKIPETVKIVRHFDQKFLTYESIRLLEQFMIFGPLRILRITVIRFLYVVYVVLLIRSMMYSNRCHWIYNILFCLLGWRWARWFRYRSTTSTLAQIFEFLWAGCGRFSWWRWFWCTFLGNAFIIVRCWLNTTWCIWCSVSADHSQWMTKSIYMQFISLITIHTIFTCGSRIRFGHILRKSFLYFSFFAARKNLKKLNENGL